MKAPEEDRTCHVCDEVQPSMDRLVDHLTDRHDAFTKTMRGTQAAAVLNGVQLNISLSAVPDN